MTRIASKTTAAIVALCLLVLNFCAFLQMADYVYGAEAAVASITLSRTDLSNDGGDVHLEVTGSGLTSSNWGVTTGVYIEYPDQLVDASNMPKAPKVTVSNVTENGADLTVSANAMNNDFKIVVNAGVLRDGEVTSQATADIRVSSKGYRTQDVGVKSAGLIDDSTVRVEFETRVEAAAGANLLNMISFKNTSGKTFALTGSDKASIEDGVLFVTVEGGFISRFNESQGTAILPDIIINEAALKLPDLNEALNKMIEWTVEVNPRISSITLDKDVLMSEGGTVTAKLNGYRADSIDILEIKADVYVAGQNDPSDIAANVKVGRDSLPEVSFKVPANATSKTQSYWLNIKVSGIPVYQGTAENKANLAVISVLPEGQKTVEPSVGKVTMSANNYTPIPGGIEVIALKSLGALKTELRIFGTGLDDKTTKLHIVDENGIEWPVYDIPE